LDAAQRRGEAFDIKCFHPPANNFLGHNVPFLDPGGEILSWVGKHWNINNNLLFSARFEKYLNAEAEATADDKPKTVSAMHLAKAKNAAVSGDRATLEAELKSATENLAEKPGLEPVERADLLAGRRAAKGAAGLRPASYSDFQSD
jgi:hypothetical protein